MKKNINELNLYGFEEGKVDSGKVVRGGEGGNWGGSMERALEIASFAKECGGKNPTSQKRTRKNTASGNVSDHYYENTTSYAIDIPASGSKGDKLLACIMKKFNGGKQSGYTGGKWLDVNLDGYRYQFGWKVKDHFNHIHVGVKKGGGGSNDSIPSDDNTNIDFDNDDSENPPKEEDSLYSKLYNTFIGSSPSLKENVERIKKLME
jgi:hypothetical protein